LAGSAFHSRIILWGQMRRKSAHLFQCTVRLALLGAISLFLTACNPEQSALHPAGQDAAELSDLFWFMTFGGALVWCIIMGATVYAVLGKKRPRSEQFADRFIFFGGVIFPTVGLAILLLVGLALLPSWREEDPPDVRIHVAAEQYWWRFSYETADGGRVGTANEIHLPAGSTVEFVLTSTDVIHSFWIPALGGKLDAIPGRTNLLRLRPTTPGVYRGVCAEFCGPSHTFMAFPVIVSEQAEYDAWLAAQALPATATNAGAFLAAGCGACHIVRGVSEAGSVGPDLTHLASRRTIGAASLPLTREALDDWIVAPTHIKPGARMPSFATLPDADRAAIVDFLMDLR
jgi:cytochrome c oxidase subunit 2